MSATCAADERVLSSGTYIFQVVMGNGSSRMLKLVKHKSVNTLAVEWICCVLGLMANYILLYYTILVLYRTVLYCTTLYKLIKGIDNIENNRKS